MFFVLDQVGTIVCRVKATDHDGDEVEFSINPSPSAAFPVFPIRTVPRTLRSPSTQQRDMSFWLSPC